MLQKHFLEQLKLELPENVSLNDAIATALDITYDAAHRRSALKSKFSIDETVTLAKYYNLSLDRLFETTDKAIIAVQKTKPIHNEVDLQNYFLRSYHSLLPLLKQKESRIFYSAKDIPLFYTLKDDLLSRFKMFVWLKLLDTQMNIPNFDVFSLQVETLKTAKQLGNLYSDLNITEIWYVTTVNSTLKQIHFYNQSGLVTAKTALQLCIDLKALILEISKKVKVNHENYKLYYNELLLLLLLLMNNNVLVKTLQEKSLFATFTILSYFQTSDKITTHQAEVFLNKQLQSSKLLNTSGKKEQRYFFNKIFTKIDALYSLIKASKELDFE